MTHKGRAIFLSAIAFMLLGSTTFTLGQSCPAIEIETPAQMVTPGKPFQLRAVVRGATGISKLQYEWSISSGIISEGNGTESITVETAKGHSGTTIHAKLKVLGFSDVCQNSVSEQIGVVALPTVCPVFDSWPSSESANSVKAHVDNLFISLNNNPDFTVLFRMTFADDENRQVRILRIKKILDAIKFRNYDLSRITFLLPFENDGSSTEVVLYPSDQDVTDWINQGAFFKGPDMPLRLKTLFQNQ